MQQADTRITSLNHATQGAGDEPGSYLRYVLTEAHSHLEDGQAKLTSFRDLILTIADVSDGTFYALTNYLDWLALDLAAVADMLHRRSHLSAIQGYQPVVVPKDQAGEFSAALATFQNANMAYSLADNDAKDDDAPPSVWRQLSDARQALLESIPVGTEQARQLLSVCLAEMGQDMTVGGPLPEAILGAMGASIRAREQPDPTADPAVIAGAEFERQYASIIHPGKTHDVTDDESAVYHAAYLAIKNATPTTPAGVAAKLRASLKYLAESEIDDDALSIPLADLAPARHCQFAAIRSVATMGAE
jgi:hypothetical protein